MWLRVLIFLYKKKKNFLNIWWGTSKHPYSLREYALLIGLHVPFIKLQLQEKGGFLSAFVCVNVCFSGIAVCEQAGAVRSKSLGVRSCLLQEHRGRILSVEMALRLQFSPG
jgi:hypothetical protein